MARAETVEFTNMCMICDGGDPPNLKLFLDMRDMLRVFKEENLSKFFCCQESSKWKYNLK